MICPVASLLVQPLEWAFDRLFDIGGMDSRPELQNFSTQSIWREHVDRVRCASCSSES